MNNQPDQDEAWVITIRSSTGKGYLSIEAEPVDWAERYGFEAGGALAYPCWEEGNIALRLPGKKEAIEVARAFEAYAKSCGEAIKAFAVLS